MTTNEAKKDLAEYLSGIGAVYKKITGRNYPEFQRIFLTIHDLKPRHLVSRIMEETKYEKPYIVDFEGEDVIGEAVSGKGYNGPIFKEK